MRKVTMSENPNCINEVIHKLGITYFELLQANVLLEDLISELDDSNSETNLTKTIGVYAKECPQFFLFFSQQTFIQNTIRKVCTGELPLNEAKAELQNLLDIVIISLQCFDKNILEKYYTFSVVPK